MKQFTCKLYLDVLKQDVPAVILYMRSRITKKGWCWFSVNETPAGDKWPDLIGLDFVWVDDEKPDLEWATEPMLKMLFPLVGGGHSEIEEGEEGEDLYRKTFIHSI